MSEMVERVARAIFDAENGLDGDPVGAMLHEDFRVQVRDGDKGLGDTMKVCRAAARAAIEAMLTPTSQMLFEGVVAQDGDDPAVQRIYQAMLQAALKEPTR